MFRKKRNTPNKVVKEPLWSVEMIVNHIFANVHLDDKRAWQKNIKSATKVATLITASANRLGCSDASRIKNIICGFVLADFEQEQLEVRRIYFSFRTFRMADEHINQFKRSIHRVLARMHAADVDSLLVNFFNEESLDIRERMFMFWYNLPPLASASLAYLRDWAVLEKFLMSPDMVMPYVDQLESDLQAHVAARADEEIFGMDCAGRYTLPRFTSKRYKVLSSFFYEWAASKGFKQSAKILRPLESERFLKLLVELSLIKDSGVNDEDHGIWSHAIQLYAFIEYAEDYEVFNHSALKILQSLGGGTLAAADKFPSTPWNYIFDTQNAADFSCPDYVKSLMWYRFVPRWPLLSESVWRADRAPRRYPTEDYMKHLQEKHKNEVDGSVVIRKFQP